MSNRIIELFLFDVLVAILKIEETSKKFTNSQDLLHDYIAWDSVIREFEIIGEASKYLIKDSLLDSNYQEVVDFRNKIIHEYFGINCNEVWSIVHTDLEKLKHAIKTMIIDIEIDLKNELIDAFIIDNSYLDFVTTQLSALNKEKNA